jgi:hypothetical protein
VAFAESTPVVLRLLELSDGWPPPWRSCETLDHFIFGLTQRFVGINEFAMRALSLGEGATTLARVSLGVDGALGVDGPQLQKPSLVS